MRILHTPSRFYPDVGGVQRVVLALGREFVRRGHEVTVLCADDPGGGRKEVDGIRVLRLPYAFKVANTNITPSLPYHLLQEHFDIIHTHIPTPWSADWSALIGRLRGKATIVTYHNNIVGRGVHGLTASIYNATLLHMTLHLAHRIIVNSPSVVEHTGALLKRYQGKVVMIPNGVDTERFRPQPSLPRNGTVGFLGLFSKAHRYKGLDVLLRAMAEVIREHKEARLLVGGSGPLLEEYKGFARSLGLGEKVEFIGFVPERELGTFFSQCSVFVLPSTDPRQEGFGIVALEALACGVPVVVTSAAGVAHWIKGAGKVVPPGDPTALAQGVLELLKDPYQRAQLGQKGRALVEGQFSWTSIAEQVARVYRGCLKGGRA